MILVLLLGLKSEIWGSLFFFTFKILMLVKKKIKIAGIKFAGNASKYYMYLIFFKLLGIRIQNLIIVLCLHT